MTDRIFIRDLCLHCSVGVYEWEQQTRQTIKVNLDLEVDLQEAGASDDLVHTVDYKAVRDRIEDLVSDTHFQLLETVADKIAGLCLQEARVRAVRVRVEKPGALRSARTVGVDIHRSRE